MTSETSSISVYAIKSTKINDMEYQEVWDTYVKNNNINDVSCKNVYEFDLPASELKDLIDNQPDWVEESLLSDLIKEYNECEATYAFVFEENTNELVAGYSIENIIASHI